MNSLRGLTNKAYRQIYGRRKPAAPYVYLWRCSFCQKPYTEDPRDHKCVKKRRANMSYGTVVAKYVDTIYT